MYPIKEVEGIEEQDFIDLSDKMGEFIDK